MELQQLKTFVELLLAAANPGEMLANNLRQDARPHQ
jgi:hypothetical protein